MDKIKIVLALVGVVVFPYIIYRDYRKREAHFSILLNFFVGKIVFNWYHKPPFERYTRPFVRYLTFVKYDVEYRVYLEFMGKKYIPNYLHIVAYKKAPGQFMMKYKLIKNKALSYVVSGKAVETGDPTLDSKYTVLPKSKNYDEITDYIKNPSRKEAINELFDMDVDLFAAGNDYLWIRFSFWDFDKLNSDAILRLTNTFAKLVELK